MSPPRLLPLLLAAFLLVADGLIIAPPPARTLLPTPACGQLRYADEPALLAALAGSDYVCTEELALALRPLASPATLERLLALAGSREPAATRRNALRVIGRLAGSPRGSRAHELLTRRQAAATQQMLAAILRDEHDNFLLQDAIWLFDSFYYPAYNIQPDLARISHDAGKQPVLRTRAAAALGRLVYARPGPLHPVDLAYIRAALASDQPGVRAQAALIAWRLRPEQLAGGVQAAVATALHEALAAETPLSVAADQAPDDYLNPMHYLESPATPLVARAAMIRALERLAPEAGQSLAELRAAYEHLALPAHLAQDGLIIRAGMPPDELPPLAAMLTATRALFLELIGPALATPLPGETGATVTALIFPGRAAYHEYLQAFTPFALEADGLYNEADATLYTYARAPAQSEHSLAETLSHELAHALAGRYLFPGRWRDAGYHNEPKGWADEGLAELLAGIEPAAGGHYRLAPRRLALEKLCTRAALPDLAALLARRVGYDQFGRFDYPGAWALSYYLFNERPDAAQRLYGAYREGTYRLRNWPALAGTPSIGQFEQEWHKAIKRWCTGDERMIR